MHPVTPLIALSMGMPLLIGCQTLSSTDPIADPAAKADPQIMEMTTTFEPQIAAETAIETIIPDEDPVDLPAGPSGFTDTWDRLRAGFTLSHELDRQRVTSELKWFVRNPDYVERVTRRAAPHLHYIVTEIEKRGMPQEFALLPIVESAYDPFAYSHGRAAGLWQFIPSTARLYGLRIDWWYDGRRDVRASTKAALDYLEYLHDLFKGDWLLALAAYNAGQGNILSSIRKSNLPRSEVDFWSLKVLRETHTYVPRLLAISEIIANPESYHMVLPEVKNEPYWKAVGIGGQLDLNKAAELAGLTPEKLYSLNPGFNQWATHPDGPHELLLPVTKVGDFQVALAELPGESRVAWQRHMVRSGENLGTIAIKYRTTVSTIQTANNLSGNLIRTGDSLLIPSAAEGVAYTMTRSGRLASRQTALEKVYGGEPVVYTVKSGDSFWEISRRFSVGMRELARWNGMGTSTVLQPGTRLKIFKQGKDLAKAAEGIRPREQLRKLNYRVRAGESLSLIASKFNITVASIKSWNEGLGLQKYIHPGDRLTLYVDVTSLIN